MQGAEIAEALPFTAYEQAVFVALFIVLIGLILFWVSRENATSRTFQREEAAARETAQAERDEQWRSFLKQQRESDQQANSAVKESLDALVAVTKSLVQEVQGQRSDFQTHDQREWAKLDEMSARIHEPEKLIEPKTQPRRKT